MLRFSTLPLLAPLLVLLPETPAAAQTVSTAGAGTTTGASGDARGRASARAQWDLLDFEAPAAATIVSEVHGAYGLGPVGVRATRPALGAANAALVFDSARPPAAERDLGTPHADFGGPGLGAGGGQASSHPNARAQRRVLVTARSLVDKDADGRVDRPGGADGAPGSIIELDFGAVGPVVVRGLMVVDVETGPASIVLLGAGGSPLAVVDVPLTGDNGAAWVDLGERRGVHGLRVRLGGSGAIDDVVFRPDAAGTLESSVWVDADGDGLRSPDEPGLSGVRVVLRSALGTHGAEATTRWDGRVRFQGLAAGTYAVEVDRATLPAYLVDTTPDVGGDERIDSDALPALVTLAVNDAHVSDVGFGFASACQGGIGDRVWFDADGDGLQDAEEPGIQGVVVSMVDSSGAMVAEQVTGPDGGYQFLGLCADTYTITVDEATLPPFYTASPCDVGEDDTIDSDCSPLTRAFVFPQGGGTVDTVDFGYTSAFSGSIGDFLWLDSDCDGYQDEPILSFGSPLDLEPGIGNGRIVLRDDMGVIIGETTTNPDGRYAFSGLPPGRYRIDVDPMTLPPSLVPSFCNPGLDDASDNDCTGVEVELESAAPGVVGAAVTVIYDFGYRDEPCGGIACASVFWKTNTAAWPAPYAPDQLFSEAFDTVYLPGMTLLDVLCTTEGGAYAFAREAVAALLNSAASPTVAYALTSEQVDEVFDGAFAGQIVEIVRRTEYLAFLNEQNCPF